MNANKAVELGFADKVMYADDEEPADAKPEFTWNTANTGMFSRATVTNSLLGKIPRSKDPPAPVKPTGIPAESFYKRLSSILH